MLRVLWLTDQPKTSKGQISTFPERDERSGPIPPGKNKDITANRITELREEKEG